MNIVDFAIRKPVTITMLVLAALIFGYVSFQRLAVNLLPDISYPSLTVRTEYEGAAPQEIENLISRRIEEDVGGHHRPGGSQFHLSGGASPTWCSSSTGTRT